MAYTAADLSVLAYANGFTFWHYKGTDNSKIQGGTGFFNNAYDVLRVGDIIMSDRANFMRVKEKSNRVVTIETYNGG